MTAHAASHVYFGLNPMWVSTCILAVTYAIIMSEKVNRAIVALVGAGVMIIVGVLDQEEAIRGIDFNTLGLLTGMMILVSISRRSGMFEYRGGLVGARGQGASRRHPAAAAAGDRRALGLARQRHHGAADRAGDARHHQDAEGAALPLSVRRDHRLQHRRHRHADRRSAQHHDRLAGRAHLQRFRLSPDAGDPDRAGGADGDDPPVLGPRPARRRRKRKRPSWP